MKIAHPNSLAARRPWLFHSVTLLIALAAFAIYRLAQ